MMHRYLVITCTVRGKYNVIGVNTEAEARATHAQKLKLSTTYDAIITNGDGDLAAVWKRMEARR